MSRYLCLICEKSTLFPVRGYRGCCAKHHKINCDLVKTGKTTWEQLIKEGKALPVIKNKVPMYNKRRKE